VISNLFKSFYKSKDEVHKFDKEGQTEHEKKDYDDFTQAMSFISEASSQDDKEKDFSVIEAISSSKIPDNIKLDSQEKPLVKSFSSESIFSNLTSEDEREEKEIEESYREIKESLSEQEKQKNKPASQKTFVENVKDTMYYIKDAVTSFIENVSNTVQEKFQELNDYLFKKPESKPSPTENVEKLAKPEEFLEKNNEKASFQSMHESIGKQMSDRLTEKKSEQTKEKSFVQEYEKSQEAKEQSSPSRLK